MDVLILHDSVTSSIGHLENIGSLSYADPFNTDIFRYTISKNHLQYQKIKKPLISSEKAK